MATAADDAWAALREVKNGTVAARRRSHKDIPRHFNEWEMPGR